ILARGTPRHRRPFRHLPAGMRRKSIINTCIASYLTYVNGRLAQAVRRIHEHQDAQLLNFIRKARSTEVGRRHGFRTIRDYATYARQVPVVQYDDIRGEVHRMMRGETDILWPGLVTWFSKSSGTT